MNSRVVWKCAVVEYGAQCVMMDGETLMPGLYVGSLDLLRLVNVVSVAICSNSTIEHTIMHTIGAIARSEAFYGQGSGDILLDNVGCTGNETRLIDCSNNGIGIHNCRHSEDASVTCQPQGTTATPRELQ